MDYEKKYNEALERAREWYNKTEPDSYTCIVESIFPELKESEDEQHRKWILEYLYDGLRKSDEQFKGQFKAAIAWLEKQGEKPASQAEFNVGDSIKEKNCTTIYKILEIYKDGSLFVEDNLTIPYSELDKWELVKKEPKFKVGDWCIDNEDGTIFQIVKVLNNTYTYETNEGKEYSCTHYSLENDARLWTIADAKCGDVLSTE